MIRKLKNRGGYVLAWVVCMFLVIALLSAITLSMSITASQTTLNQHDEQQVYFTAKSVAGSVAKYINANANNAQLLQSLINNQGTGSIPNMGDYTVDVSYVTAEKIKIKATAVYRGESYSVSAYLVKPPAPSGIIPTDNVIFVNGSTGSGLRQCKINGNVYVNGDINLSYGSAINGFVVAKGDTTLSNAGNTTTGMFSFGNVYLKNGAVVSGDLNSLGDIKMDGGSRIGGNARSDGSLTMLGGATISNNAVIQNNARFEGGPRIYGSLSYGGSVSSKWGSVSDFVSNGATKISDYAPIDSAPYTAQPLPVITAPSQAQMPGLYNTVVINNNTISNSGKITSAVVSQMLQKPWGTTITINARSQDINLLLDNTNLSLSNGVNIEIDSDGTHNVFLYMTGNSSFSIKSNEYVGMKVRGSSPRFYIIGDGQQSVSLANNSELDACVYIPNGSLTATGSPLTTYKFIGVCIVKSVNIQNDVYFHYSKPDTQNTPLNIFESDASGGSDAQSWVIDSWGKG